MEQPGNAQQGVGGAFQAFLAAEHGLGREERLWGCLQAADRVGRGRSGEGGNRQLGTAPLWLYSLSVSPPAEQTGPGAGSWLSWWAGLLWGTKGGVEPRAGLLLCFAQAALTELTAPVPAEGCVSRRICLPWQCSDFSNVPPVVDHLCPTHRQSLFSDHCSALMEWGFLAPEEEGPVGTQTQDTQ